MHALRTSLAALGLFVVAGAQEVAPQKPPAFDVGKLAWLAGTWEIRKGERVIEEHWLPFKGSTMMGVSHTYDAETTRAFEFLRIAVKNGTIAYLAQPGGAAPTPFVIQELDDKHAVFDNVQHDYPQRIRYERTAQGMTATTSLIDGSRAEVFVFTRRAE